MKRFLKIFVPIILALSILAGIGWYLFFYDKGLTQDILLSSARFFRNRGSLTASSWFYDRAYEQGIGKEAVAIEKANQYIEAGNFTQAEVTLTAAINDGCGIAVYTALSDVFVKQDKLLDAVNLLDRVTNPVLKKELDELRPKAPIASEPGESTFNELTTVTLQANPGHTLYVSTNGQYPSTKTDIYSGGIHLNEGRTDLKLITVSENGLVSPLFSWGYTVIGVIKEVPISDIAMDQQIRAGLGLPQEHTILTSDLWKITQFTIPAEAKDYTALSYMIYLESLSVESGAPGQFNNLKNIKALKSLSISNTALTEDDKNTIGMLTSLESLTLDDCRLTTSASLTGLRTLKYLNLSNNDIGDISAISFMEDLTELNMHRNALRDLATLASCKKLTRLTVSNNSITSVSVLQALTELIFLDISHNQITDISPLEACTSLKDFRANHNLISDLSALANCVSMEYIDVSNNTLSNIDTLGKLSTITYMNFSHNQVTQIPALSKGCRLITIDGSYNLITDLSPLAELVNLSKVLMDYNEGIESVAMLEKCPVINQVNVYGTKVTDVSVLTELKIIVNYNPIEAIENNDN